MCLCFLAGCTGHTHPSSVPVVKKPPPKTGSDKTLEDYRKEGSGIGSAIKEMEK